MKHRLDLELVAQGFFETQDEAARAVMAGEVSTSDRRLEHPGEQVKDGIELHVKGRSSYVSRGGLKL
ncbi:MAG: TlyA family RNA methyltransferase, partial [Atopobiaceae bacterium]|nr:TlyA family RNA methyltransferase [Atopobiaceae bacterium]